jgi:Outer membrane efflux protein
VSPLTPRRVLKPRRAFLAVAAWAAIVACLGGCRLDGLFHFGPDDDTHFVEVAGQIQYDDTVVIGDGVNDVRGTPKPLTLDDSALLKGKYRPMTLEEAIEIGLRNSKVLRELGGAVLRSPENVRTIYEPAIVETDPRFGTEGALSVFDPQFSTTGYFEKNDRALNNIFTVGGTRQLSQDFNVYQTQLTQRMATGTEVTLRNNTQYDANNAPGNLFGSAWTTYIEGEFRQPLLQGAGVFFNRTAGPGATPGVMNGLLVARVNRDISLSNFHIALRDYVADVENAYWDLYFAYHDLNTKRTARDQSLTTWQTIRANFNRLNNKADNEAQAREQYYRFQQEVQDAMSGRVQDGTRTNNGSSGGTFRRSGGVLVAERRLRLLMGLPINDGMLIRPVTEPSVAPVEFDWDLALSEALRQRPELLRQRQRIKHRELQLAASRNFLKPRFDAVGRYRFRGFGKDLIDSSGDNPDRFNNAYEDLTTGDFQEWQLGFEFSIPLGFRQAHAAVRNAELQVARERTILKEQERQIVRNLSDAYADVKRAAAVATSSYNRVRAAKTRVDALQSEFLRGKTTADQLLEAQSRMADSEDQYFQGLVEYMIAVRNVHFEKGSLLEAKGVHLQDAFSSGPLPSVQSVTPLKSIIPDMMPSPGPAAPKGAVPPPAPGLGVPDAKGKAPAPMKLELPPAPGAKSAASTISGGESMIEPTSAERRFGDELLKGLDDPLSDKSETRNPKSEGNGP